MCCNGDRAVETDPFCETVYEQVEAQRPGSIDRIYLQVYAGGAGNVPASWNDGFGELKVIPGLWSVHGDLCNVGEGGGGSPDLPLLLALAAGTLLRRLP